MHTILIQRVRFCILFIMLCIGFILTFPIQIAHAQVAGISLISNPPYPDPHTEVTLSLDDYSVQTRGGDIVWYIDGVEQKDVRNNRSITIMAGEIGEKTLVTVKIVHDAMLPLSAQYTITPTNIDLILESDTYVPNFYKGRTLPSSESTVHAIAIVHDGTNAIWSNYSYKWTLDETILSGGTLKGKYAIDVIVPRIKSGRLTVEVYNGVGKIIGKKSVLLGSIQPFVQFYEYSPLRGLSQKIASSPLSLVSEETTLYAEPYFLNTKDINVSAVDIVWKLNNTIVPSASYIPNALVLTKSGDSGSAKIDVSFITKQKIPQYMKSDIDVAF